MFEKSFKIKDCKPPVTRKPALFVRLCDRQKYVLHAVGMFLCDCHMTCCPIYVVRNNQKVYRELCGKRSFPALHWFPLGLATHTVRLPWLNDFCMRMKHAISPKLDTISVCCHMTCCILSHVGQMFREFHHLNTKSCSTQREQSIMHCIGAVGCQNFCGYSDTYPITFSS